MHIKKQIKHSHLIKEIRNIEMVLSKNDENIDALVGLLKSSMLNIEKAVVDAYLEHKRMAGEIKERIKQLKSIDDSNA